MGYADTGMDNAESFLFNLYRETDENRLHPGHCSAGTYGCSQKQDYHTASYGKGAEYTRKNFKEDLREIILQEKPDTIFTTSQEDVHGDHSGLFLFVREILEEEKENGFVPTLYTGLVHSKAGDDNWPRRGREDEPYTCPPGLDEGSLKWNQRVSFPLPEDMLVKDENGQNKKARALAKHKTALKEDAVEFLYTFIRPEEIFWKI
jgi:LmbE family N-acetylglucosaminyl deacetylase